MLHILRRLKQALKDERGDALVVGAVGMVAILAFAGLAIDVGQLHYQKRKMQAAVDAAALAATIEIGNCNGTADCTNMKNAAKQALVENGYTASSITVVTQCATSSATSVILTINNGPCALGSTANDPNYGHTQYVEAELHSSQNTMFAGVIGIFSVPITVRAEAGSQNSPYCLYTSAQSSQQSYTGITINSGGGITSSCGIFDDSTSGSALSSNPTTVTAQYAINIAGGWSPHNGGTFTPTPATEVSTVPDPLNYLNSEPPTPSGSCTSETIGSTTTLSQGTYCGMNLNSGTYTVTLNPGTYVFEGSINDNSGVTLQGTGVTLYFTSGSLTMNSSSTLNLTAPTTGTYAGILIWQSTSDSSAMILDSNSSSTVQGAIYLPDAQLTVNGGSNLAAYTILDVGSLMLNSNITLGNNYSSLPGGSPIKGGGAVLVE